MPLTITLEPKSIYRNRVNQYYGEVKFALPSVKVGTIFEYSYISTKKHWGGLSDWYFQRELPTVYSKYDLHILPGAAFQYQIHKNNFLGIDVQSPKNEGKISFAMSNIPGLREEPHMDATKDYIQRVEFQIAEYTTYYGVKKKTMTTWEELSRELLFDQSFGKAIEKNLGKDIEILRQVATLSSELDKMKAIHNYVRKNFTWNGTSTFFAREPIRKVWDRKGGNAGEVNLTMINLMRDAGLDANPLLVSERDNGKVNMNYPFVDQFNKVMAYVAINGKTYVLDGTDQLTPSELIPFDVLNTYGFLVAKKNPGMVALKDDQRIQKSIVSAKSELTVTGELKGEVYSNSFDYSRLAKAAYYKKEGKAKYEEKYLVKALTDFKADSLVINNLDVDSLPLEQRYNFSASTVSSGDYRLVSLDLFSDFNKNPFVSDIRFTNIDFGAAINHTIVQVIKIPASMKPDVLPKTVTLVMPDKSISFSRACNFDDKTSTVTVRLKLEIVKPVFTSDEYPGVKEFFKKMMEMTREQLVLKTK